jgi:hypothetical protein
MASLIPHYLFRLNDQSESLNQSLDDQQDLGSIEITIPDGADTQRNQMRRRVRT